MYLIKRLTMKCCYFLWLALCAGMLPMTVRAQQSGYNDIYLLKDGVFTEIIKGYNLGKTYTPKHGKFRVTKRQPPNYRFKYTPDSGFVGTDTLIIEYWSKPHRRGKHSYKGYVFHVKPSLIDAADDYYTVEANSSDNALTPLANDSATSGVLQLSEVLLVNHGTATLTGDTILFTPHSDITGQAYIVYKACDDMGSCDLGTIIIAVVDDAQPSTDTLHLITKESQPLTICLKRTDLDLQNAPAHGSLDTLSSAVFQYLPNSSFVGSDTVVWANAQGDNTTVFIEVISAPQYNTVLIDDRVDCAINRSVQFDVSANDLTDNFRVKLLDTPDLGTLTHDTLGIFTYTPPADYEGIQQFRYTLRNSGIDEVATVTIYINDGHPVQGNLYQLTTTMNTPLVLNYEVPIADYDYWEVVDVCPGAAVDVYEGWDTLLLRCDTVKGRDLIVFHPPYNYIGNCHFTLRHCVNDSNHCVEVDFNVKINLGNGANCPCVGDCVWKGDINYDGKVNMKDLLYLGYHLGQTGPARSEDDDEWRALRAEEWDGHVKGLSTNLKHCDTDGDGTISESDTLAILQNYYREHSAQPELVGPTRAFPFYLNPLFDSLQAGDLAVYEVILGDQNYPAYDVYGYTYTVHFSFEYDSSSLKVTSLPYSWYFINSGNIDMFYQPVYQQLDVGITRTNGKAASGFGAVQHIEIIIEEDIDGFRVGSDYGKITLQGQVIDARGNVANLPPYTTTLPLRKTPAPKHAPGELLVYPNPASDYVNIHLNGGDVLYEIAVLDINGRLLLQTTPDAYNHHILSIDHLKKGMYLIRARTARGTVVKKLLVTQ